MLRDIFGIDERDTNHEARRKITGELMLLDDVFQELLPILFDFMGVGKSRLCAEWHATSPKRGVSLHHRLGRLRKLDRGLRPRAGKAAG
jgi:hypothetical protein